MTLQRNSCWSFILSFLAALASRALTGAETTRCTEKTALWSHTVHVDLFTFENKHHMHCMNVSWKLSNTVCSTMQLVQMQLMKNFYFSVTAVLCIANCFLLKQNVSVINCESSFYNSFLSRLFIFNFCLICSCSLEWLNFNTQLTYKKYEYAENICGLNLKHCENL